ncbi:MAG TPA: hypothetical protein VGN72_14600 [Tepidisphaeraceae bacterium]|nr:hypothetical protein [Tepidisphaeraceae bacterium]
MPDERTQRSADHLDPLPDERPSSDVGLGAGLTAAVGGGSPLQEDASSIGDTDRGGTSAMPVESDARADKSAPDAPNKTTHPGGDLQGAADAITNANRAIAPDSDSPN